MQIICSQIYLYNNETQTSTITPYQNGPGSNGNQGVLHTFPKFPELKSHHQIQFSVLTRTQFLFAGEDSFFSAGNIVEVF